MRGRMGGMYGHAQVAAIYGNAGSLLLRIGVKSQAHRDDSIDIQVRYLEAESEDEIESLAEGTANLLVREQRW